MTGRGKVGRCVCLLRLAGPPGFCLHLQGTCPHQPLGLQNLSVHRILGDCLIEKLCNRSPEDVPLGDWEVHPHCTAGKLSPRDGEGLAKTM